MRVKCIILFFLIGAWQPTTAKKKFDFSTAVNAVYARQGNQISYEKLSERLWKFYQYPIDLNKTSKEKLNQLHILSEDQLVNFFNHIDKNGLLVSIYELQAIRGFDLNTINCLIPFIKVEEKYPVQSQGIEKASKKQPTYGYWLSRYIRRLETSPGYEINLKTGQPPYQGSPDKLVTRIKWKHPNGWGFGIAAKKDPGEPFTWDIDTERYGFDVWSAYILLENKGYLKRLIIGDYEIGFGQGLVLNAGFSMDKSGDIIPIIRTTNIGIKPHTSVSKYGFRGIATTLVWKSLEQTIYYAYNSLDGEILQDKTGVYYTETIKRNGSHRTHQEINKKAQIYEQIIGSTVVYTTKRGQREIGVNAIYSQYDTPLRLSIKKLPYHFAGKDNFNLGLFYRYLWYNLHFFGEAAICKSGAKGGLLGIVTSLASCIDLAISVRHYDADFHNFYGKAFGEASSGNYNEQGIHVRIGIQPIKKLNVNAYYDYFKFPKATTKIAEPSSGYTWLTKATYQFDRTSILLFQYKQTHKDKNIPKEKLQSANKNIKEVGDFIHRTYKTQFKKQATKSIHLNTQAQASTYDFLQNLTWGYVMAQSITYKIKKLTFSGQIAWVDADYENRLYVHEKEPLYNNAMGTMYYMKGIKSYLMIGYKPTANWRIEGKYSIGWYPDEDHLGSGNDIIEGNIKNEFKLQLIYKF